MGKASVTLFKISKRGKVTGATPVTIDAGASLTIHDTLTRSTVRLIVSLDPPQGAAVPIRVIQDVSGFAEPCESAGSNSGACQLVFDAVP